MRPDRRSVSIRLTRYAYVVVEQYPGLWWSRVEVILHPEGRLVSSKVIRNAKADALFDLVRDSLQTFAAEQAGAHIEEAPR
jgi:hypothetical protein